MSEEFMDGVCIVIFFALTIGVPCGATKVIVDDWWRDELNRRGHAYYYLDENNQRQWNWKDQPK